MMKYLVFTVYFVFCLKTITFGQDVPAARYPEDPASIAHAAIPKGEMLEFQYRASKIYPGTQRTCWVYVPTQYHADKPACLYVNMDGLQFNADKVFDYLIEKGEMPVTIGVFVQAGEVLDNSGNVIRYNRSNEFDNLDDDFVTFLLDELLPEVKKLKTAEGMPIRISDDPNDCAIGGASSGAICAFTAAWQRPDAFSRVFSAIGTYVAMRGGDQYPALIRKTAPKPLRIFLQDGSNDAWNPLFGSWFTGNLTMEAALSFANYEVEHRWGTGGHDGVQATAIFPDAMRWLWKGWPKRIEVGISNNDMLQAILTADDWKATSLDFLPSGLLTSMPDGSIALTDAKGFVHKVDEQLTEMSEVIAKQAGIQALSAGPDGEIYLLDSAHQSLSVCYQDGKSRRLKKGINGKGLMVTEQKAIYITSPDKEGNGKVLLIKPEGEMLTVATNIPNPSGITMSADRTMLLIGADQRSTVYNGIVNEDGTLIDQQKWCWLHDVGHIGTTIHDMAVDDQGNVYIGSDIGIQVCDQNGRVRAILPVPKGDKIKGLCFGGKDKDTLFVLTNRKLYRRKMKIRGVPTWSGMVKPKSIGAG